MPEIQFQSRKQANDRRDGGGLEQRFQQSTPTTKYTYVDVLFATAGVDTAVEHQLLPAFPDSVNYEVVQSSTPVEIYHDASRTRRNWTQGIILLRSSVAGAMVRLRLSLPADEEVQTAVMTEAAPGPLSINGQILFPATQNPSTNPNVLDDYEEGTFTPTLQFGGSGAGIVYSTREGYYVKVGRVVHITIRLTLTNKGAAAGNAIITSLPFAHDFGTNAPATGMVGYGTNFSGLTSPPSFFIGGTSGVNLQHWGAASATALANTHFTNTTDLLMSATYRTTT